MKQNKNQTNISSLCVMHRQYLLVAAYREVEPLLTAHTSSERTSGSLISGCNGFGHFHKLLQRGTKDSQMSQKLKLSKVYLRAPSPNKGLILSLSCCP
jgi:hypothetical protein